MGVRARRRGLMAAAAGLALRLATRRAHSHSVGAALVQKERARQSQAAKGWGFTGAACVARDPGSGAVALLQMPALNLLAAVLEGADDAQLSVAIGHL